jgi:hypothetical protein
VTSSASLGKKIEERCCCLSPKVWFLFCL